MPPKEPHENIERLALEHVPGTGAVGAERLGAGLVNDSYRVLRGGRSYSLRVPAAHAAVLGLDHGWECRVLRLAAARGLAPEVEHCDPGTGILVMRWVHGRAWTAEEVRLAANVERIAQLIKRVHELPMPPGACTTGPAAWIVHYRRALALVRSAAHQAAPHESRMPEGAAFGNLAGELAERLAQYAELPAVAPVLCHSDLHVQNLMVAERGLVLLDWEYAHASEPLWDLAGWIINNELDADCSHLLLERYLGRSPSAAQSTRLRLLGWLYGYLCVAWIELYLVLRPERASGSEPAPDGAPGLAAQARALAQRLRRL